MAIAGLLVIVVLLIGCNTINVNVSNGAGKHELGPDKDYGWESSKDSQSSTDAINRVESKISGIDKSQNEISEKIDKTSETAQEMQKRDETLDRLNPNLPKDTRRKIYKDKK